MGRTQRFSRLNNALRDGAARTGPVLSRYLSTRPGGTAAPNTVRSTTRGATLRRQLHPFGFTKDAGTGLSTPLAVSCSGRSLAGTILTATTVSETDLGLDAVVAGTKRNQGFISSKAILAQRATTRTPVASAYYTGLPYTKIIAASYTQPFGQTTTNKDEFTQQASIKTKIAATAFTVSFQPERLYA